MNRKVSKMKEVIECPQCEGNITAQHIMDLPHPFHSGVHIVK